MEKKKWVWGVIVLVVLVVVGYLLYISLNISADVVDADKTTKLQLVDSKGEKVARVVPLSLIYNGQIKKCGARFFAPRQANRCKIKNVSYTDSVRTESDGSYLLSVSGLKKRTDTIKSIPSSFILTNVGINLDYPKTSNVVAEGITVSFYSEDYISSVNMVLKYSQEESLDQAKEEYFSKIESEVSGETGQTAIKNNVTDFVVYLKDYFIHNPLGNIKDVININDEESTGTGTGTNSRGSR